MKLLPEVIPPGEKGEFDDNRQANGRFAPGYKGGPGNTSERINVARLAKRYCRELGMDVEALLAEVVLAMLYNGACGDVAAARLAFDMLAVKEPSGPLVAIGIGLGDRVPQPPALTPGANGAPALSEHLERLIAIAEERGLVDLRGKHPAKILRAIAEREAEKDLLS